MENLEGRVASLEYERKADNVEKICRSYRFAGVIEGLAIACLIYAIIMYARGSNS